MGNIDLRLPNITEDTPEGKISQLQSYIYQLVGQLNWALNTTSESTDESASEVVSSSVDSATLIPIVNSIVKKAVPKKTSQLVNDSNFITNAYHDSTKQNTSTLETDVKAFINKTYIESLIDNGNEVSY